MKLPKKMFKKGDIVKIHPSHTNKLWYKGESFSIVSFYLHYSEGSIFEYEYSKQLCESKLDTLSGDISISGWLVRMRSLKNNNYFDGYAESNLIIDKRMTNLKELLD